MQQHHIAVRELGELLDVFDDRAVSRFAVQRHQNGVVHGCSNSFSFVFLCPASSPGDNLPRGLERVRYSVNVQRGDQDGTAPTRDQQEPTILPFLHSFAGACEMQEWEHGKWKL